MPTLSFGTFIQADITTPGTFVTLNKPGNMKSYTMPTNTLSMIDVSGVDQSIPVKQYLPGLSDGGELELDMLWDVDDMATFVALYGKPHSFRQCVTATVGYTFSGFVMDVSGVVTGGVEDYLTYKVKVKANTLLTKVTLS